MPYNPEPTPPNTISPSSIFTSGTRPPIADGDVEGGHRLVGDDELGADGEGAGDADALALASAELPRPAIGQLGGEPDALEQFVHPCSALLAWAEPMDREYLLDRAAHRLAGVQGREGILEDDLGLAA